MIPLQDLLIFAAALRLMLEQRRMV